MFEEVTVWRELDANIAVRYTGFRNLQTTQVWIAFGNFVHLDCDEENGDLTADQLISAHSQLESFLRNRPKDAALWKPTVQEAIALFVENNPFD